MIFRNAYHAATIFLVKVNFSPERKNEKSLFQDTRDSYAPGAIYRECPSL